MVVRTGWSLDQFGFADVCGNGHKLDNGSIYIMLHAGGQGL